MKKYVYTREYFWSRMSYPSESISDRLEFVNRCLFSRGSILVVQSLCSKQKLVELFVMLIYPKRIGFYSRVFDSSVFGILLVNVLKVWCRAAQFCLRILPVRIVKWQGCVTKMTYRHLCVSFVAFCQELMTFLKPCGT